MSFSGLLQRTSRLYIGLCLLTLDAIEICNYPRINASDCFDFRWTYQALVDLPIEYFTPLDAPDPVSQSAIQDKVCDHGPESPGLGSVPAEFVVSVERGTRNGDRRVSEC